MKLKDAPAQENPVFPGGLISRDIRAVAARLTHPSDPLAGWRIEFDEWRKASQELQQLERAQLVQVASPLPVVLRQHRWQLFLQMARGEELALALLAARDLDEVARNKLLEQVDALVGCLDDSWHTWHGEALPEHRAVLAKFFAAP